MLNEGDTLARAAILHLIFGLGVAIVMIILLADEVERLKRITSPQLIVVNRKPAPVVAQPEPDEISEAEII